jgi:DnaJ-class molecular chaperone
MFASSAMEKNYYQILGIDTVATDSQIKDAYRALAKKYHPDVRSTTGSDLAPGEHDPDVEKFRDVVEAY